MTIQSLVSFASLLRQLRTEARLTQEAGAAADAAATGGAVSICAIGGMAGVGKTAFAVHAALYRDLGYRLSEAHAVTGWP